MARRRRCGIRLLGFLLVLGAAGCTYPAKDGGPRTHVIDMVVIHTISGPKCVHGRIQFTGAPRLSTGDAEFYLVKMERDHRQVSIHYVVGRNGERAAGVPENVIAYHAGNPDVNGRSIGIELVNDGNGKDPFPPAQIEALVALIKELRGRYPIPLAGIVRHSDVDQRVCVCAATMYSRRSDPGSAFPFDEVRAAAAFPAESLGQLDFLRLKGLASKDACS